ncbi:MAG: hypothetical protein K1X53_08070 [Candidatus Sumerlaeaceae bacterium]|nr:hypothetical protein [Candidatus Sumerlaeaceae bacterium]
MGLRGFAYRLLTGEKSGQIDDCYRKMVAFDPRGANPYLEAVVRHARENVPHFRDLLANAPQDARAALATLPVLTKDIVRAEGDRMLAPKDPKWPRKPHKTGGSTAEPFQFLVDLHHQYWARAAELYIFREFLGLEPLGTPTVEMLQSREVWSVQRTNWRRNLARKVARWDLQQAFVMNEPHMRELVEALRRRRPVLIKTYIGSIYQLALYIREKNVRLPSHPRHIYCTSELVRPHMREVVEEVFQCRLTDVYASREGGPMAAQCEKGNYHILESNVTIEVLDDAGLPVEMGGEGNIILTCHHNFAQPFLRYSLMDTGALGGDVCSCRRRLPILKVLSGRVSDHFRTADGGVVHGQYFASQFFEKPWVRQFQIRQHGFHDIEFILVPSAQIPPDEVAGIEERVRWVMGAECRVKWTTVDEIPRTAIGKHHYTLCLIEKK